MKKTEGKRLIAQAPFAFGYADEIAILRIVESVRAIDRQSVRQCRWGKAELRPTSARADGSGSGADQSSAAPISEVRIETLKRSSLKSSEVATNKNFTIDR